MIKKPHIAIVFAFNDDIHRFIGGSRNGFKEEISYFDQFLMAEHSISNNWKDADFEFSIHIVHERPFNEENVARLNDLGIIMHRVIKIYPNSGLRHLAFNIDVDCDYILALDNDMVAINPPKFDYTKDALISYGGSRYNYETWKDICNHLNMRMPANAPLNTENGFKINAMEYERYYNDKTSKILFPAVNAGALMIKKNLARQFSHTLAAALAKYRIYSIDKIGKEPYYMVQNVYGIALNEVTQNWAPFERGFNLLLSDALPGITDIYLKCGAKENVSLVHYIHYPVSDPMNYGLNDLLINATTYRTGIKTEDEIVDASGLKVIGYPKRSWHEVFNIKEPRFAAAYRRYRPFMYKGTIGIDQIKTFSTVLAKGGNITISRFNDGEWAFILEIPSMMNSIVEKRHPGNRDDLMNSGAMMKRIIESNPEYMISIDKYSLTNGNFKHKVLRAAKSIKNRIGSGVFNVWAMWTGFEDLFEILKGRKVLLVGPEEMKNLPIKADHIVTDRYTSVYKPMAEVERIAAYMEKNYRPNMVILYSCSFTAKIAIHEMYNRYGNKITQLDVGAAIVPFYGKTQRPWSEQIFEHLEEIGYLKYE